MSQAERVKIDYNGVPSDRYNQEKLIRIFTPSLKVRGGKTKPLSQCPAHQIYGTAKGFYEAAINLTYFKSNDWKAAKEAAPKERENHLREIFEDNDSPVKDLEEALLY